MLTWAEPPRRARRAAPPRPARRTARTWCGRARRGSISAAPPMAAASQTTSPGCVITYQAFAAATPGGGVTPVRSGSWPSRMFTATPVRKPSITERETNLTNRPSRSTPKAMITTPVSTVSRTIERFLASAVEAFQCRPRCQRRGRGRGHHHERGTRAQCAADLAGEGRIQAVGGVHARQHRRGHPVRNRADRTGDAGHRIGGDVRPARAHAAQPPHQGLDHSRSISCGPTRPR